MARITITIPDGLHRQVLKQAKKQEQSVSYAISRLIELGLFITNNKNQEKSAPDSSAIDEHCNKLIIQINGILKEIAIRNYDFTPELISQITQETLLKYEALCEAS